MRYRCERCHKRVDFDHWTFQPCRVAVARIDGLLNQLALYLGWVVGGVSFAVFFWLLWVMFS